MNKNGLNLNICFKAKCPHLSKNGIVYGCTIVCKLKGNGHNNSGIWRVNDCPIPDNCPHKTAHIVLDKCCNLCHSKFKGINCR